MFRSVSPSTFAKLRDQLFVPPAPHLVGVLQQAQLDNVRRNAPTLLAVAGLNIIIIMAVCANSGMRFSQYSWMIGLVVYCVIRILVLRRRLETPLSPDKIPAVLRRTMVMSVTIVSLLSIAMSFAFVTNLFSFEIMIPVSLAFGTMAIAQCLYSLRVAAVATLVLGKTPIALAMIFTGSFDAQMLGASMLSIMVLMVRFVLQQFNFLVERIAIEQEFRTFANTDALTEIGNRRSIIQELKTMVDRREPFAIALLDLDDFKQINDQLGHGTGDCVLQHVAKRLSHAVEPGDSVGRLGGDEFVAILRNISGANTISARTTAILAHLCQPIDTGEHKVPVGASLGYATFPEDADTLESLLHAADMVLYAHKRGNGGDASDARSAA